MNIHHVSLSYLKHTNHRHISLTETDLYMHSVWEKITLRFFNIQVNLRKSPWKNYISVILWILKVNFRYNLWLLVLNCYSLWCFYFTLLLFTWLATRLLTIQFHSLFTFISIAIEVLSISKYYVISITWVLSPFENWINTLSPWKPYRHLSSVQLKW